MINISLNGQLRQIEDSISLQQTLEGLGYRCEKIAVAINGEFVPRTNYANTFLSGDDKVDVVLPVQGG